MDRPPPADAPSRLVLDFSQPMRPRSRVRVKITPAPEPAPSGDVFAFPNRRELYAPRPAERADPGGE